MRRWLFLCGLLPLGACTRDESGSTVIARDSSGVEIMESRHPVWGSTPRWTVSDTPMASIGTPDGPVDYQFTQIVGATRFEDSVIAVADAGTNSVRLFGTDGKLTQTIGRTGDGPGEFRAMQSLRRSGGDSLVLLDRRLRRVTVFDRSGKVLKIVQLPARYVATYRLPEARWLAAEEEGFVGGKFHEEAVPGLHRFPAAVVVLDSTGAMVDTVGVFPGAETAYLQWNGQLGSVQTAFGRSLSFAAGRGQWFVVTGDYLGFDVYAIDGRHLRSVRTAAPDRTLQTSDVSKYNAALLAEIPDATARDDYARFLQAAEAPKQKAVVSRILQDPHGNVWLSAYENSLLPAAVWYIFDDDSRYLGAMPVPPGLRILEIGERYVLGVKRDENGVESVHVYELTR